MMAHWSVKKANDKNCQLHTTSYCVFIFALFFYTILSKSTRVGTYGAEIHPINCNTVSVIKGK